jgi:hypothetical protein
MLACFVTGKGSRNRDLICSRAYICACYEVEEWTNEKQLHSSSSCCMLLSSLSPSDKKIKDETATRLFCKAVRGWRLERSCSQKPRKDNRSFRVSHFFPSIFLIARSNFPPSFHPKEKTASGLAKYNSRLYRLNSTFYNGTKGINRNAIRYDSKFICMQDRTG